MDSKRLEFWKSFLIENLEFPYVEKLSLQLSAANFTNFCNCGCNSFAVEIPGDFSPSLTAPSENPGAVYETYHRLIPSGKSLEVVLHVNKAGNLCYVNIDCNANSEPPPGAILVEERPYHKWASSSLVA